MERPIEAALTLQSPSGWRAGTAGEQTIRLFFDQPQALRRVQLLFIETQRERAQEFVLKWSEQEDQPGREIVRQQYHFSPQGSTRELEDYQVTLVEVRMLELTIVPDRMDGGAHAFLESMQLA